MSYQLKNRKAYNRFPSFYLIKQTNKKYCYFLNIIQSYDQILLFDQQESVETLTGAALHVYSDAFNFISVVPLDLLEMMGILYKTKAPNKDREK